MTKYLLSGLLGLGMLALDQGSKAWISAHLPLGERMDFLPGIVELRTVHNYGAAWSSFSGQRWLLAGFTAAIILVLLALLVRRTVQHPLGVLAIGLVISGGLGNLIDRVRLGYVVDMLHLEFWPSYPVFNVADIAVVCGTLLGAVYYLWFHERDGRRGGGHGDADPASES